MDTRMEDSYAGKKCRRKNHANQKERTPRAAWPPADVRSGYSWHRDQRHHSRSSGRFFFPPAAQDLFYADHGPMYAGHRPRLDPFLRAQGIKAAGSAGADAVRQLYRNAQR